MADMRLRLLLVVALVLIIGAAGYKTWGYYRSAPTPLEVALQAELPPEPFVDTTDPNDLLPDLLPLPARDLRLERTEDGRVLMHFSTTYYNQGRGALELVADPKTAGVRADIERDVLQRIYQKDGKYRELKVGTFLWHQEHLHYHYTDFITYDLEPIDAPQSPDLSGNLVKSTFCLRDVSRVYIDVPNIPEEAGYKICGKERQGVSVGWGDTYYHDYPAQNLDITELKSGTYRLTFHANPELRLEEVRYDNNTSTIIFALDMEKMTVSVLKETPSETPDIEHVHLDEPFGNIPR